MSRRCTGVLALVMLLGSSEYEALLPNLECGATHSGRCDRPGETVVKEAL